MTDTLNMALVILIMAIGTYIVGHFSLLFALAAVINGLGIVPYILYSHSIQKSKNAA